MRSSYDGNILANSNIYSKDINSSRNFYGKSSKLENLQNLYFYLNPYSKSTSINVNQQLKQLKRFQSEGEGDELDKKYGKPIINNYKRFHIRAEEIKKGPFYRAEHGKRGMRQIRIMKCLRFRVCSGSLPVCSAAGWR